MFHRFLEGFTRIAPTNNDPNRVIEVHVDDYVANQVICRDDCLVLYQTEENELKKLDMVLLIDVNQTSNKAFSLLRSEDEVSAQLAFCQFRDRLPLLVQCVPDVATSKFALQSVSQLLRERPSWTAAHVAAHFGYLECFRNPAVQSQVNICCEETLMTPLHVAVKAQQIGSVVSLVELDARLDVADVNGDTVFHYAATTTRDIIQVLCRRPVSGIVNAVNQKGCTPFHLACMADKTDCVMELLKAGVDVNLACGGNDLARSPSRCMKDVLDTYSNRFFNSDIKYGGTPLHWSKTPELTEVLIEHGCNVNTRNFRGDTALHVMVRRNRLSCAVVLLSHRADADIRNSEGNTPLHLAIKSGDLSLVQTFISFGADVDARNERGESPRHLAAADERKFGEILFALHVVGALRCTQTTPTCAEGCAPHGHFNGIPPERCDFSRKSETVLEEILSSMMGRSLPPASEGCRVLCLDGGGIRGMVLIQMLDELERMTGRPIVDCFDLVAGTSTGGVLALVLATGKTMRDCRCLYFRLKDKVFVGTRPYDADLLENFLKDELGESTVMGDIKRPRLMITATRGDRKPADLHIFRNYPSPLEILGHDERDPISGDPMPNSRDQLIWQAARASGAAPTYFRASGPFIDGGLISNNPTLDALTEIQQCNEAHRAMGHPEEVLPIRVVVSMGTGRPPLVPVNTIDVFRPDTLWGACRMALGVTNLGQLLVDQATQTDGRVTARALAMCGMLDIPYIRLNPQLTENVALDETNTKTLVKMLWETTAYMRGMREELMALTHLLT